MNAMIRIAHELENIGDACFNLMVLAQRRYDKNLTFADKAMEDLGPYSQKVAEFIGFIKDRLNEHLSKDEMETAYSYEDDVNDLRKKLRRQAQKRLRAGADVRSELLFIEVIRQHEQVGDHALNIAQALREIR